jgi:hypothetical protein
MDWKAETFRVTVVLLAASVALIGPGVAGVGGSGLLVIVLVGLTGVLFILREPLGHAPRLLGHDIGDYGEVLWLGALVAACVVVIALDASAAELQALGGIVGLAGMGNYFLRPLYGLGGSLLRAVGLGG